MPVYNPQSPSSNLTVLKNGVTIGTRPAVNLIEGTQVALTVADDAANTQVNTTISSTAGGSSAGAYTVGVIASYGEGSIVADAIYYQGAAFNTAGILAGAAPVGIFIPVQVLTSVTVFKMAWFNGATVAGNIDVGLYNSSFTRLASLGSTAMSGVSAIQVGDIADTALTPDTYYLAMATDSITATFNRSNLDSAQFRGCGCLQWQNAGVFPLPASVTLSNLSAAGAIPALAAIYESSTF